MIVSKEKCAEHLAGMVRFPTVSYPEEEKMDFTAFEGLRNYLAQTYPLIHGKMKLEIVGKAALLYHWESNAENPMPPVMLAAHQDVVPAGDETYWTDPPFSGAVKDGYVWGRGASDSKGLIMAHMEALEGLVADGFEPDYDIYLGYGYNEEVGSKSRQNSAELICRTLQERGVRLGILIDEGGFVMDGENIGADRPYAAVWISEKGYATYKMTAEDTERAKNPLTEKNVVADLARAIVSLNEKPFPDVCLPEVANEFRSLVPYADGKLRDMFANAEDRLEDLLEYYKDTPLTLSKFRTLVSITEISSSTNFGRIPDHASAQILCRLLPGDSSDAVRDRLQEITGPNVEIRKISATEASPYSKTDGPAFAALSQAILDTYPDAFVFPSLLVAGTDARNYYPICDCVCRFTGFRDHLAMNHGAHSVNEHFAIDMIDSSPKFFYHFLSECWSKSWGSTGYPK